MDRLAQISAFRIYNILNCLKKGSFNGLKEYIKFFDFEIEKASKLIPQFDIPAVKNYFEYLKASINPELSEIIIYNEDSRGMVYKINSEISEMRSSNNDFEAGSVIRDFERLMQDFPKSPSPPPFPRNLYNDFERNITSLFPNLKEELEKEAKELEEVRFELMKSLELAKTEMDDVGKKFLGFTIEFLEELRIILENYDQFGIDLLEKDFTNSLPILYIATKNSEIYSKFCNKFNSLLKEAGKGLAIDFIKDGAKKFLGLF